MYRYGGQWNQMQPPQPPSLPPGWEVKWDPNSKRWFYINHATKTTQWEPPQASPQVTRQQPTTTSFIEADPAKVKTITSEYDKVSEQLAKSLLRINQNSLDGVRRALSERGYAKKKVVEPRANFVTSLKSTFPSADIEVIKEVLVSSSNNFAGARLALESMGYTNIKKTQQSSAPSSSHAAKKASATKVTTSKAPSTKTPKKLTDAEKKKRLEELKKKFPNIDESLIELSLVGTMYDMDLASSVLQSSMETVGSTFRSKNEAERSPASKEKEETFTSASFSPVIFGAEDDKPKVSQPETKTTAMTSVQSPTTAGNKKVKTRKREIYVPKAPIYRKPAPGRYTSPLRIAPMGPNPQLHNGPNLSLLLDYRIQPMGPNPGNRKGPQSGNRSGPQKEHYRGSAGIAVGPMARMV